MADETCQQLIQTIKHIWPDFKISKQDVQTPTSEFVIAFIERFLSEVNVNVEEHFRFILSSLREADAFHNIMYIISLYKLVQQFFVDVETDKKRMDKFYVMSLIQPKRKSNIMLLKFLVNYLAFKAQYNSIWDAEYAREMVLFQKKGDIIQQIDMARMTENKTAMKHATMENLKQECRKEIREKVAVLAEIEQENDQLEMENQELKTQHDSMKTSASQQLELKEELQDKIARIKQHNVLKETYNQLQIIRADEQKKDEKLTVLLKERAKRDENHKKYIEHKLFTGISVDLSNIYLNSYRVEINSKQKELHNLEQSTEMIDQLNKKEQSNLTSKHEELDNLNSQWKDKLNEIKYQQKQIEKELDEIKLRVSKSNQDNTKTCNEILEYQDAIKQTENRKKSLQQLWLKNYQLIMDSKKELLTQHQKRHKHIQDKLEKLFA